MFVCLRLCDVRECVSCFMKSDKWSCCSFIALWYFFGLMKMDDKKHIMIKAVKRFVHSEPVLEKSPKKIWKSSIGNKSSINNVTRTISFWRCLYFPTFKKQCSLCHNATQMCVCYFWGKRARDTCQIDVTKMIFNHYANATLYILSARRALLYLVCFFFILFLFFVIFLHFIFPPPPHASTC